MKSVKDRVEWLQRNIKFREEEAESLQAVHEIVQSLVEALPENNTYDIRVRTELASSLHIIRAEIAHVKMDREQELMEIGYLESGQWVVDETTGFGRPKD